MGDQNEKTEEMMMDDGGDHNIVEDIGEEIEVIYDDDDDDLEVDDWEGGTDGEIADDEGGDEDSSDNFDTGMLGFTGEKPSFILNAHLESAVYCCSFDTSGDRLLTGGGDDVANLWNDSSKDSHSPICKCRGHSDSVISAVFNCDSSYFSTADLSGVVKVWNSKTYENTNTFEVGDLSWSFWHPQGNVLFAGCDDGSIYMWKIPTGDCKILTGSSIKCECASILPDGKHLVAGYADGGVKIFDLKTEQVQHILIKAGPQSSAVLCTDSHPTLNICVVGCSDGLVKIFNTTNGKLLNILHCSVVKPEGEKSTEGVAEGEKDIAGSVESVSFSQSPRGEFLAAGSVTGNLVVWDVTQMTERMRMKQDVGLTKLVWDPCAPIIYTGGLDGVIRAVDVRSTKVEKTMGRHHAEVLDLAISKDGKKIVSCSEDGSVFLFNLKQEVQTATAMAT